MLCTATSFADFGFDGQTPAPSSWTPGKVASEIAENDAHVIGMSTDPGHATLLPELVKELKALDREDIMVVVGGVIPAQDYATCATFFRELLIYQDSLRFEAAGNSGFGKSCTRNNNFLYENGASAIFGPGTVIPVAAQKVIAELDRRHA